MFNAIIPLVQPIVAVQIEVDHLTGEQGLALLAKLETYFMLPVVMVAWDRDSKFTRLGAPCPESMLTDEELTWRKFELPLEPEIPF